MGLSHELDLDFDDMNGQCQAYLGDGGNFLNFLGAPMIYQFMYVGLIILQCVLNPGFLASYWSAGFGTFLQVSANGSLWLEDCAKYAPTPEENDKYSANHS